jgi:hypothetical protein
MIRVFFSYSHDSVEHKERVRQYANDLMSRGFDVLIDQANLKPSMDIGHFVESAIESADYVLLICTPAYAAKANARSHGVGEETVIIKSELNEGVINKFIAVLIAGRGTDSVPKYMKTRLWVDLTNSNANNEWEKLCTHMMKHGEAGQIGTLVFEALFPFDENRIYDKPRLQELKRFTDFVETGRTAQGRWFVVRRDPIKNDLATILFQDPIEETS